MGASQCCDNCQAALQRCGKRSVSNDLAARALQTPGLQSSAWQGAREESALDLLNFSLTFGGSK